MIARKPVGTITSKQSTCLLLSLLIAACSSDNTATTTPNYNTAVPQTGQTESIRAGDDGDWQAGTAWPEPRFLDNADGTVIDKLTGLIWLKNLTCLPDAMSWSNAIDTANALHDNGMGECELSDGSEAGNWRLPNVRELYSVIFHGDPDTEVELLPFSGRQSQYWSSTTFAGDPLNAWLIAYGYVRLGGKAGTLHVWPVRGGLVDAENENENESDAVITLPRTGQLTTYRNGDDGDWQTGAAWPNPRFTDNADGTSRDELTGLTWLINPSCYVGRLRWDEAIDSAIALSANNANQCDLTDGSSSGQWRLPNVLELLSIIDYGQAFPALPKGHPFLPIEQFHTTWTSTPLHSDAAYDIELERGGVNEGDGFDIRSWVVPVRDGMI